MEQVVHSDFSAMRWQAWLQDGVHAALSLWRYRGVDNECPNAVRGWVSEVVCRTYTTP